MLLAELPLRVRSLDEVEQEGSPRLDWQETEETYAGNALAKARVVAAGLGAWVLAEDSGLEVDGLGGAPGVRSHRFAGPDADDARNIALLLSLMRHLRGEERKARFRAAAVLVSPSGESWVGEGTWEGRIAPEPRGRGGFGYDPVFIPSVPAAGKTVAEIEAGTKCQHSHRGKAVRSLWPRLVELAASACE